MKKRNKLRRISLFAVVGADKKRQKYLWFGFAMFFYMVFIGLIILIFSLPVNPDGSSMISNGELTLEKLLDYHFWGGIAGISFLGFFPLLATAILVYWGKRGRYFKKVYKTSEAYTAKVLSITREQVSYEDYGNAHEDSMSIIAFCVKYAVIIDGRMQVITTDRFPCSRCRAKKLKKAEYFKIWYSKEFDDILYLTLRHSLKNVDLTDKEFLDKIPVEPPKKTKRSKYNKYRLR